MTPASCIACKIAGINGVRTCNDCRTRILISGEIADAVADVEALR